MGSIRGGLRERIWFGVWRQHVQNCSCNFRIRNWSSRNKGRTEFLTVYLAVFSNWIIPHKYIPPKLEGGGELADYSSIAIFSREGKFELLNRSNKRQEK